jgi:hypothetical protein
LPILGFLLCFRFLVIVFPLLFLLFLFAVIFLIFSFIFRFSVLCYFFFLDFLVFAVSCFADRYSFSFFPLAFVMIILLFLTFLSCHSFSLFPFSFMQFIWFYASPSNLRVSFSACSSVLSLLCCVCSIFALFFYSSTLELFVYCLGFSLFFSSISVLSHFILWFLFRQFSLLSLKGAGPPGEVRCAKALPQSNPSRHSGLMSSMPPWLHIFHYWWSRGPSPAPPPEQNLP